MERSLEGQEIYVSSMEKSAQEKLRVFPYVKSGIIVDMGAGAGPVTELLTHKFGDSKILAVDIAPTMVRRLKERFQGNPKVEVIEAKAEGFSYPTEVDSVLFVSTLHEVFSFNDYSHEEVIQTLARTKDLLKKGGRLIIRDGVQPEEETLYVRPIHPDAYRRFLKFVKDFKVRPLVYALGTWRGGDSFVQHKPKDFDEFVMGGFYIEMHSQDVSELLSKYFYNEANWPVELSEQYGIWTLREYQKILLEIGFAIVHAETYVLPYLLQNHYSNDFEVFKLNNGGLTKAPYPPSTMILVAEK